MKPTLPEGIEQKDAPQVRRLLARIERVAPSGKRGLLGRLFSPSPPKIQTWEFQQVHDALVAMLPEPWDASTAGEGGPPYSAHFVRLAELDLEQCTRLIAAWYNGELRQMTNPDSVMLAQLRDEDGNINRFACIRACRVAKDRLVIFYQYSEFNYGN